jgi:uncharacterized membrane protein (GlpM family)
MNYLYTALKFIVGGGVIVGVTLFAKDVDPRYGGMLAAAPILTTLAFLFTYSETDIAITRQLVLSALYFAIPTLLFLIALYILLERYPVLPSVGGAYGIWVASLLIVNRIIS